MTFELDRLDGEQLPQGQHKTQNYSGASIQRCHSSGTTVEN